MTPERWAEWEAYRGQVDRIERAWARLAPTVPVYATDDARRIADALEALANAGETEAIGRMVIEAAGGAP